MEPLEKKQRASLPLGALLDAPAGPRSIIFQCLQLKQHILLGSTCRRLRKESKKDTTWSLRMRVLGALGHYRVVFQQDWKRARELVARNDSDSPPSAEQLFLEAYVVLITSGQNRHTTRSVQRRVQQICAQALQVDRDHFWAQVFELDMRTSMIVPFSTNAWAPQSNEIKKELQQRDYTGCALARRWTWWLSSILSIDYKRVTTNDPVFRFASIPDNTLPSGPGLDARLALSKESGVLHEDANLYIESWMRAWNDGCVSAAAILATVYEKIGHLKTGHMWWERGAALQDLACMYNAALNYFSGFTAPDGVLGVDRKKAWELIKAAADLGDADSAVIARDVFTGGLAGETRNPIKAVHYAEVADCATPQGRGGPHDMHF